MQATLYPLQDELVNDASDAGTDIGMEGDIGAQVLHFSCYSIQANASLC